MPNLNLIPETLYQAMMPYQIDYDNLPLHTIYTREEIINDAVDINSALMREAIGTSGTLGNRLRVAINDDGSLKADAIDAALHNIADHADDPLGIYVKMTLAESDKLALISDAATAFSINVHTPSVTTSFIDAVVEIESSDTITWEVDAPSTLKAHMAFPTTAVHRHYYGLEPVTTDYLNYKTTSLSTIFTADTLRVYVNGIRVYSDISVLVPDTLVTTWTTTSFTPDETTGTFIFNRTLDPSDIVRIDFDTLYT